MKLWKVQKFFGDIVYDLRQRGLLPVVILLLVAMVAVPVVISRGSSDSSATASPASSGAVPATPEAENAVVSYTPGIRSYRRRLNDLSPKNPFRQQFSKSAAAASQLNSTVTSTAVTSTGTGNAASTVGTAPPASTGGSGGSTGGGKKKKSKQKYTYSLTVYAGDVTAPLTPFQNVLSLTPLPSQDSSVVVFYGLSSDHSQALFLVSTKVDALNGPGTCLPAPDDCSLLTLPAGASEDLHYTKDGKTYRIVVAQIKRVAK
jgi:hypothetical protein